MVSSKVTLFLGILCSMKLEYGIATIHTSRGSQQFSEGFMFIGKKSFDNGNFVVAICDKLTSTMECNVTQNVYSNKGNNSRTCSVTLKGDNGETDLVIGLGVAALGKNKAILYWGEDSKTDSTFKIGTVDFTTCKWNGIKTFDPAKKMLKDLYYTDKIVMHDDDSFDIFINVPKKDVKTLAILEIDGDGNGKGDPLVSNVKSGIVNYLSPLATRSSSKGYAALRKKEDTEFTLTIVKPDGSEVELDKFIEKSHPAYSTGENVLSVCSKVTPDSDLTCKQYDEAGNAKFSTVVADKTKKTQPKAIQNLQGGGMLVLLAETKECEIPSCNDNEHRMIKIASDGKIVGTAPVSEFDSVISRGKQTHVYKNADAQYCAVMIGENPNVDEKKPSYYEILHHCVTEDEFKA